MSIPSLYTVRKTLDDVADHLSEREGVPEVELLVQRLRESSVFVQGYAEGARRPTSLFGF